MFGTRSRSSPARGVLPRPQAAVRLLDEHEQRVVVLKLDALADRAAPPVLDRADRPRRSRRARGWRARALRVLALALIVLGTLALCDAVVTLVWQEPFSALYAKLRQDHLSGVLRGEERALPTPLERRALASLSDDRARIAYLARAQKRGAGDGSPVGRIIIPRVGASFVVVNGTSTAGLESGPGILRQTVFPGVPGTTAIAGHRTTFLAPFRHIDELRSGNRILLEMPYAHFTYSVSGHAVVAPTDVHAAVARVGYSRLVLSACTPLFSAAKRLLVYARLTRIVPVGAGRIVRGTRVSGAFAPQAPAPLRRTRRLPAVLETVQPHLLPPLVQ